MYQAVTAIQPVAFRLLAGASIGKARPADGVAQH